MTENEYLKHGMLRQIQVALATIKYPSKVTQVSGGRVALLCLVYARWLSGLAEDTPA